MGGVSIRKVIAPLQQTIDLSLLPVRRSCETQLVDDLATTLNESGQTDAIFLDISKAFDTVPIIRLCTKLNHYGIRGSILKWIENFQDSASCCQW